MNYGDTKLIFFFIFAIQMSKNVSCFWYSRTSIIRTSIIRTFRLSGLFLSVMKTRSRVPVDSVVCRRTPLKNKPRYRLGLCYVFNLQYRLLSTNYTRKLVYQLRTNCPKSLSTSSRTLKTFTQQETMTPCLLFILQSIYLHNLFA